MSLASICSWCAGRGKYQEMGEEPCPSCAGTGRDTKSNSWSQPCKRCKGKTTVTYCRWVRCDVCSGKGEV